MNTRDYKSEYQKLQSVFFESVSRISIKSNTKILYSHSGNAQQAFRYFDFDSYTNYLKCSGRSCWVWAGLARVS